MENINLVVIPYKKVIEAFKNRYDVQNGNLLGYRPGQNPEAELPFENWPKSIGQGMGTTGFCVTVSQALFMDNVFQTLLLNRGAQAKLISIDIKEQYYGKTFSGNQNKWHTAVLVQDSGINIVIDLTCRQFGNNFVNKDIWDYETWESTFRSPLDKHEIFSFEGKILSFLNRNLNTTSVDKSEIKSNLYNVTTINDAERNILVDFFTEKLNILNTKLLYGNINKFDYEYLEKISKLIENLDFVEIPIQYSILAFSNKETAINWLTNFTNNSGISEQFLILSSSIESNCNYFDINKAEINIETSCDKTYIIFEVNNCKGFDISFIKNLSTIIPYGIKLYFDPEKDIFNGGMLLQEKTNGIFAKTNTIYIKCTN